MRNRVETKHKARPIKYPQPNAGKKVFVAINTRKGHLTGFVEGIWSDTLGMYVTNPK